MTTQNRELASLIDNSGNVTATGNLTVSGTTTTISSTVQTIADPLIEINTGAGSNSNDLGFVFERGSTGDNATLIWDESADAFAVGTTTATGTSTGNMSYTTGDFLAGKVTVDNVIINGTTIGHTDDTDLMTLADGGLTVAGTIAASGVVTANAGVHVDGITIDGTEIDLSSGDLTLDVAGDIILDADGADVKISDGGTHIGTFTNSSSDFVITSAVQDKDIIFKGDDNGSAITALTLDMSDAGKATFNSDVVTTGKVGIGDTTPSYPLTVELDQSADWLSRIYNTGTTEGDMGVLIRTGSEHDGTSILSLYSGSGYKFKFQADGMMGIGTTSPTSLLEVKDDGTLSQDMVLIQGGGGGGAYKALQIKANNGDDLFHVNALTYKTCLMAGSTALGIHTATPASPLDVRTANSVFSHFGGIGVTDTHYSGISLGYSEAAASTYRKAAIVQEQIGDSAARGHMHFLVDTVADGNSAVVGDSKMMIHGTSGNVNIGTTTDAANSRLNVSGGIRYTWNSTGHGLNNVSYQSFNNSNVANGCGNVYYKVFIVNIYHNNGSTNVFGISNGGGGVGYNFTCLRPDTATPVHGQGISFSLTTIGSSAMTFNFVISSGGGALTIERTSGTGTFYVSVHNIAGT